MTQEEFNRLVDMMPYIVFGGAALICLILIITNGIIKKISNHTKSIKREAENAIE